jgi:CelD/BcsL family acetyltransferase involved in cellulose biosynthesis
MTGGLAVDVIHEPTDFGALVPDWWELWERSPSATPFQSPAWLTVWWQAFAPGELMAVTVRLGPRLVGLAPFYVEHQGGRDRLLPLGISISDYQDILVDAELKEPVLAAISGAYAESHPGWQEWELPELPPGAAALELPCPRGCEASEDPSVPCPVIELPDSMEALGGLLSARKRRSLRLLRHRLDRHGNAAVLHVGDRAPEWWVEQLCRLHGLCWSSRGQAGVLADGRLRGFHADLMPAFAARGLLRLYALSLGGNIAGVYYGFNHRRRAYGYLTGFDPAFAYYSPGSYLVWHAIGQAVVEGAREFHFLRGGEAYKYTWGAKDRWNKRRTFRKGAR